MDPTFKALLQPYAAVDVEHAYAHFRHETGQYGWEEFLVYMYQRQWVRPEAFEAMRGHAAPQPSGVPAPGGQGSSGAWAATGGQPRLTLTYTLERVLGEGGMGTVRLARDAVLGRRAAFKQLKAGMPEEVASRFFDEAQITSQLDHPHIVPVYALEVRDDGTTGYAMRLVQGKELAVLIAARKEAIAARRRPAPEQDLRALLEHFVKVCDAIAYAHSKGVLHRDLKPANIMVGRFGEVYVMDWGVARLFEVAGVPPEERVQIQNPDGTPRTTDRTMTGASIGTPEFMSPEQARGENKTLDGRSDLYTLGLILHEIVCLKPAVTGKTRFEVLTKAVEGRSDPIAPGIEGLGSIPKRLAAIISKATAAKPDDRYPSVAAFAEDLRSFLRGAPIAARPDTLLDRLGRWVARHGALAATIVLTAVVALGSLAFVGLHRVHLAEEREVAVGRFQIAASRQAHRIDGHFHAWEARLAGLGAAAVEALLRGAPSAEPVSFSDAAFDAGEVPDTWPSTVYGKPVSLRWPVLRAAPGVDRAAVEPSAARLGLLGDRLRRSFVAEGAPLPEGAAADRHLAPLPVRWAFVSLANGLHLAYPGKGGYEAGYDGRAREWYGRARDARGVVWGPPYVDAQAQGLLIAGSLAVRDDRGAVLGVCGLDMTVDYVQQNLLVAADAPGFEESFLLDHEGNTMVRSGGAVPPTGREPFALPEVLEHARAGRSGCLHARLAGRDIVAAYFRLETVGWTYVVIGRVDAAGTGGAP